MRARIFIVCCSGKIPHASARMRTPMMIMIMKMRE